MEFGLQSHHKQDFPGTIVGNPRKRLEAKAYRARDRMDHGWFSHESGESDHPLSSPLRTLPQNQEKHSDVGTRRCCCCALGPSSQYGSPLISRQRDIQTPNSLSRAEGRRNREHMWGSGAEWYCHDNKPTTPASCGKLPSSGQQRIITSRTQRQLFGNCNDWYRHEHTIVISDDDDDSDNEEGKPANSNKEMLKRKDILCENGRASPSWWPNSDVGNEPSHASTRSRHASADVEWYWQRNHEGSVKEWFPHEHRDEISNIDNHHLLSCKISQENEGINENDNLCCRCHLPIGSIAVAAKPQK